MSIFQDIRAACQQVAAEARHVSINDDSLESYASLLAGEVKQVPKYDTKHHFLGTPADTLAYILILDCINFGSGYFPHLHKRPAMSGYFTIASQLKDYVQAHGIPPAMALRSWHRQDLAEVLGQDLKEPARAELMSHFAHALNEFAALIVEYYDGSYTALVETAQHSAAKLVALLARLSYFQDVAQYKHRAVPIYKRAQITASDLALAFEGQSYGYFADLDQLTIFADNLVPHVLKLDGVLNFSTSLDATITAGKLIPAGSAAEVEIRAVSLHAVELLVDSLRVQNQTVTAQQLDIMLWNRGQALRYRQQPRHRSRTVFY